MRKQNFNCVWAVCFGLVLMVMRPFGSSGQDAPLLVRPDFQNMIFDPIAEIPGASSFQASSVTLVSGGIWAPGAAATPSDGQINLVQAIIGQPVAPAAFWYLEPALLPVQSRFVEERLTVYSAVDGLGRYRNDYIPVSSIQNQEHAAYLKVKENGLQGPTLELLDWRDGSFLSNSIPLVSAEAVIQRLLLFPPPASANFALRVSTVAGDEKGDYEIGLYPVVRPGQEVSGELTGDGPIDAVQRAGYFARDYLLWEMSRGQTARLRLESMNLDGKLEVVSLSQPTNVLITAESGSGGPGVAQVEFTHRDDNYLVRVTSGTPNKTGNYRLVVERKLPVVTGFTPAGTNVGGTVVLSGDFFPVDNRATTWVGFGGGVWGKPTSPNIQSGTIAVQVPVGAVSGPLTVTNLNGSFTSSEVFHVGAEPPRVRPILSANGEFTMEITGAPGGAVVIETAVNLSQPIEWLPIVTNQIPVSGKLLQAVTVTSPGRQQFYRTRTF